MKSGFFMITLNVENHGLTLVNLRHRSISTPRRFCSASGGIRKMCCIMNCYNRVKQSRHIAINNNSPTWAMHSKKKGHLLAKDVVKWSYFMTILDHMLRKRLRTISLRGASNFSCTRCIVHGAFRLLPIPVTTASFG